ncbi:MAG: hypothetical protein Q4F41_16695 [Eubacteriales bacterium]|nr:hypothetical protein [Eubacteriales bacterium]
MHDPDQLFLETKQEPKKLSIALSRYFGEAPLPDAVRERYRTFLRQRIRAALLFVIREGDPALLRSLIETGWLTPALYQEAVRLAASLGRTEMTALLFHARPSACPEAPSSDPDF